MRVFDAKGLAAFGEQIAYALLGALSGAVIGLVCGVFGKGIDALSAFGMSRFSLYVWFLPAVGLLTAAMLRVFAKNSPTGMGAVFKASRGEGEDFPLRNVAFQFAGTWGAHLFCASVGREGAGVQIGAAIGGCFGRAVPLRDAPYVLLVAGMAAGFSALFGTPVCALFFALEVTVVGKLRLRAFTASLFSSYAALFVANLLGVTHILEHTSFEFTMSVSLFLRLFGFGALCGLAGLFFCLARKYIAKFFSFCCPNSYVRAAVCGLLLACLLFVSGGRYSGLGTNLIQEAVSGGTVYAWDWVVKLLFTATFLSVGFVGGEVTTLFAAGACLGAVAGELFGIPAEAAACLGYAALFGAATNTLLAPLFLGTEMFGGSALPVMAIVCLAAYLFNFGHSVYKQSISESLGGQGLLATEKQRLLHLPHTLRR